MLAERASALGGSGACLLPPTGRSAAAPARSWREFVCCFELRSVPYWQCPRWYPGDVGIPKFYDPYNSTPLAVRLCRAPCPLTLVAGSPLFARTDLVTNHTINIYPEPIVKFSDSVERARRFVSVSHRLVSFTP